MAVFLNFKATFIKFDKELNNFFLLNCSSGLRDHSSVTQRSKEIADFVMEHYGEGEDVKSDIVT